MKKNRAQKVHVSKRTALESIFLRHDHRTHPIPRETFMVIVTLCFRVIEEIWVSINAKEAFKTICSNPHPQLPAPEEEADFLAQRQPRTKAGKWARRRRKE